MPIFLQLKCAECTSEQEELGGPVQLWDCSEYSEPTCVQTMTSAAESPVQAKCSECAAEEEEASKPVQAKCADCAAEEEADAKGEPVQLWDCTGYDEPTCVQTMESARESLVQTKCAACEAEEPLQHRGRPTRSPGVLHREARRGLAGASAPLPHAERIQAAFGHHDVSHVRARVGGEAGTAAQRMGAQAFASGDRIGFRRAPDLRLSAHEAAHTVQQREGLSLPNNVGRPGDPWERHADHVAEAVVEGRSAEPLLDEVAEPGTSAKERPAPGGSRNESGVVPVVQRQITSMASRLFESPVEAPAPVRGAPEATSETGEREAEPRDEVEEEPAIEAAEEGTAEAPPEGVPAEGAASGQSAAPGAGAAGETEGAGGGISAPCYNVDPPPRPEAAAEPTSDNPASEPQQKPQVNFDPWPAEVDECRAEQDVAAGSRQIPAVGESAATPVVGATRVAGGAPAAAAAQRRPSAESSAGSGGGEAETSSPSATDGSAMEGQIASGEAERDTAVGDYLAATGGLGSALTRSQGLESGISFPSANGSQEAEARQVAIAQTRAFMKRAADQIAEAVAFVRDQVPGRLGQLAEDTKFAIQSGIETEKAAISGRVAQVRAQARAGARAARAHVNSEYANSAATIEAVTIEVIGALDSKHQASLGLVEDKETNGLVDVNSRFATGRTQHEAKGPDYAHRALARGQEHAHAYERCKRDYRDDGFWDGCLTVRRAKAQQKAACETADGYKDVFKRTANKKGYDLRQLRKDYRCTVITGARRVNRTLDATHEQLTSGLRSGRGQAMDGITLARDENLRAIDSALTATLQSLSDQEFSQRQAVNDTGYLKQLAVEQLAHASAAGLARGVSAAMESLGQTLGALRERLAEGGLPDPAALAQSLAVSEAGLSGGMGTLLGTMEEGAQQAELRIQGLGAAAIDALVLLTATSGEATAQAESGFAQQMEGLKSGASNVFSQLTNGHVEQAGQALEGGNTSMDQAVAGFDEALGTIGGHVDAGIATSLGELDQELGRKLGDLDGQITREAWKAAEKEQPAWKSVVAIVLVILVIIAAALISIATLGAAGPFAVILVGALVGAVSAGLIQVINNWASGEAWHKGLAQAMIMGAIGGAIGGGLGFAGGALATGAGAAGARWVTQFALSAGADLLSEALTQTIGHLFFGQQFNWQGFVMAGAMSGVSFRAHPSGPRGGAARADVPTPSAGGAAGGRRAAVTQIAGGAAAGIGIEYITARLSGEQFDLSKAASAAASGAIGARTSRMGHGGGPSPRPTTRAGRLLERFRAFDPGAVGEHPGVGRRLGEYLEGVGGRRFGGQPDTEVPAGRQATPRSAGDETVEGRRAQAEASPATPHPDYPEVEPGVVAHRKTLDGQDDIRINRDGSVDICTDCARVRSRYATEINADATLKRRLDDIEAIADPNIKASRCAELQAELSRLRESNLRPPTDASGAVDFDAWGTRLKASGVTGDVDAIVGRAKATGTDALAAQGELRAFERARLRGHDVEVILPPTGTATAPKSAEARLRRAGQTGSLEVKTATEPPEMTTINAHVDEAHRQIAASEGAGEMSLDWTGVDISASRTLNGEFAIYRWLNGKVTDRQMTRFRYIEIVWRREDGRIMVTSRSRNPDGTVNNVESGHL